MFLIFDLHLDMLEVPLSPDHLATDIEYRASLPEIFNIKRNSLIPPNYDIPPPVTPPEKAGRGEDLEQTAEEETVSKSSAVSSDVLPTAESRKASTVKDVDPVKIPTPPPNVVEHPPKPKSGLMH